MILTNATKIMQMRGQKIFLNKIDACSAEFNFVGKQNECV